MAREAQQAEDEEADALRAAREAQVREAEAAARAAVASQRQTRGVLAALAEKLREIPAAVADAAAATAATVKVQTRSERVKAAVSRELAQLRRDAVLEEEEMLQLRSSARTTRGAAEVEPSEASASSLATATSRSVLTVADSISPAVASGATIRSPPKKRQALAVLQPPPAAAGGAAVASGAGGAGPSTRTERPGAPPRTTVLERQGYEQPRLGVSYTKMTRKELTEIAKLRQSIIKSLRAKLVNRNNRIAVLMAKLAQAVAMASELTLAARWEEQQRERDGSAVISRVRSKLAGQPAPVGPAPPGSRAKSRGDVLLNLALAVERGALPLDSIMLLYIADVARNLQYAQSTSFAWSTRVALVFTAAYVSGGAKSCMCVLTGHVRPGDVEHLPTEVEALVAGRCFNLLGPSDSTMRRTAQRWAQKLGVESTALPAHPRSGVGNTSLYRARVGLLPTAVSVALDLAAAQEGGAAGAQPGAAGAQPGPRQPQPQPPPPTAAGAAAGTEVPAAAAQEGGAAGAQPGAAGAQPGPRQPQLPPTVPELAEQLAAALAARLQLPRHHLELELSGIATRFKLTANQQEFEREAAVFWEHVGQWAARQQERQQGQPTAPLQLDVRWCFRLGWDATDIAPELRYDAAGNFIGDSLLKAAFPEVEFEDSYSADALQQKFKSLVGPLVALRRRLPAVAGAGREAAVREAVGALGQAAAYLSEAEQQLDTRVAALETEITEKETTYKKRQAAKSDDAGLHVQQAAELARLAWRVAAVKAAGVEATAFRATQLSLTTAWAAYEALPRQGTSSTTTSSRSTSYVSAASSTSTAGEGIWAPNLEAQLQDFARRAAEKLEQVRVQEGAAGRELDLDAAAEAVVAATTPEAVVTSLRLGLDEDEVAAAAVLLRQQQPAQQAAAAPTRQFTPPPAPTIAEEYGMVADDETAVAMEPDPRDVNAASPFIAAGEPDRIEVPSSDEEDEVDVSADDESTTAASAYSEEAQRAAAEAEAALQALAHDAAELAGRAQVALASVFQCQRVAATKLLCFRLTDLCNHSSLAVARVPCTSLSGPDMQALARHVLRQVQQLLGSRASVLVQAYDGESTAMRLGDNADTPTTAKQVADRTISEYRDGRDSIFAQLIKCLARRNAEARALLALEALRLLPPVSAVQPVDAASVVTAVEAPPTYRQDIGDRAEGVRSALEQQGLAYTRDFQAYLSGEVRLGQLAYLQQEIRSKLAATQLPVVSAWMAAPPRVSQSAGAASTTGAAGAATQQRGQRRQQQQQQAQGASTGAYDTTEKATAVDSLGQLLRQWVPRNWSGWAAFARAAIFGGTDASPMQLLAAYRLVHASACSELKPKQVAGLLAQVAYDASRTMLAARGRDLVNNFYQAAVSAVTGQLLLDHEDYVHKTKNLVSQLRNQSGEPGPVLLRLRHLLTIGGRHTTLQHVVGTLAKNTDSQNVPVCEALLYDEELQLRMAMAGHADEALVLRVLGHAHQAWDAPHLSHAVRTQRLWTLHTMLWTLLGPQLANVDLASKSASRHHKLLGMTAELCSVMCANVEAREQLLRLFPEEQRAMLVERGLSTDDLECEFSLITNGCGYKAAADMAMGFLSNVDFLAYVRRCQGELGVTIAKSSKAHYSYHESVRLGDSSWNDGLFLTSAGAGKLNSFLAAVVDRARNVLGQKRDRTIRSYHVFRR